MVIENYKKRIKAKNTMSIMIGPKLSTRLVHISSSQPAQPPPPTLGCTATTLKLIKLCVSPWITFIN